MTAPLLEVRDLQVAFPGRQGPVRVVDGISFHINAGETLGLVGQSGCGKTVTALSLLGLVPPLGRITGGRVLLRGEDLLSKTEKAMRRVRGREIAMIFQDPINALNPLLTIGSQVAEVLRLHQGLGRREAAGEAVAALRRVGMAAPEKAAAAYPHQLSGGMAQRAVIAMAVACRPSLLVADEPTSSLDVAVQAQILELLRDLRGEFGMAVLLITHDLGVIAGTCDRVVVMYAGQAVEAAPVEAVFSRPLHPYTRALLASVPVPDPAAARERRPTLAGEPPDPSRPPAGCRFHPRCSEAAERCSVQTPAMREAAPGHSVACHLYGATG